MVKEKRKRSQRFQMTEGKKKIIRGLLSEFSINSAENIQDALKELEIDIIKAKLEQEEMKIQ